MKPKTEIEKLKSYLRGAELAASDNADWFNALVTDLAEILGCEQKPTAIICACKQLKKQTARRDA